MGKQFTYIQQGRIQSPVKNLFQKVKLFQSLTIFSKSSNLDVRQGSE